MLADLGVHLFVTRVDFNALVSHEAPDGGAGSVSYYLDGGINMTGLRNTGNILPNPDAIQEYRVETNNYNAEYGKMSSGVITVITKSGANAFHGTAFEYFRNGVLDANAVLQGPRAAPDAHRMSPSHTRTSPSTPRGFPTPGAISSGGTRASTPSSTRWRSSSPLPASC